MDIDLAWMPVHDYAEDARLIAEALGRLADVLRARPLQLQVQLSADEGTSVTRLVACRGRARAQIETTPVMRCTVHPARNMVLRPRGEEAFERQRHLKIVDLEQSPYNLNRLAVLVNVHTSEQSKAQDIAVKLQRSIQIADAKPEMRYAHNRHLKDLLVCKGLTAAESAC